MKEVLLAAKEPLLPGVPSRHSFWPMQAAWRKTGTPALLATYLWFSMSGPILLDWVKWHHGGTFRFSIPAITFHAYTFATSLGIGWTLLNKRDPIAALYRPDMVWRFCIASSLFTVGDMLAFTSMEHLDAGTFSLVGKSLGIIIMAGLSRMILYRRKTYLEYGLVCGIALSTVLFCQQELEARGPNRVQTKSSQGSDWLTGLIQRTLAVILTSLGAVLQEKLLTYDPNVHFLMQQAWMGCGAIATSFLVLRFQHGLATVELFRGLDDWRVLVMLAFYVAHGLSAGLMVKRLGALSKALCVPITLGGCYIYSVATGSAALSVGAVAAWATSVGLIGLFGMTRIAATKKQASR